MNILKSFAGNKKREATGPWTGRIITVGDKDVRVEAVLGEGGFATIYRAVDINTEAVYALKHFVLNGNLEAEEDAYNELNVMRLLQRCPYAVKEQGAAKTESHAFILMDYCEGNLAWTLMERGNSLSNDEVRAAFLPVAHAVAALHALNPPMAHRDIKAENVLRRTDGRWILCDFGSCTSEQKVYSTAEIGREEERVRKHTTPAYRAPELWDLYAREFIGTAVDIWSLGCLLYFIAYGKLPFDGDQKLQILNGKYTVPVGRPAGVEQLIADMLVVDPKKRITAAEVVERANKMMSSSGRSDGGGSATVVAAPAVAAAPVDAWGSEFDAVAPPGASASTQHLRQQSSSGNGNDNWANFGNFDQSGVGANAESQSAPATDPRSRMTTVTTAGSIGSSVDFPPASISRPASSAGAGEAGQSSRAGVIVADYNGDVTGGSRSGRSSAASAGAPQQPPTEEFAELQLNNSQMQEHCKVLEQLLEDRNREVSTLRNELKRQGEEINTLRRTAAAQSTAAATSDQEQQLRLQVKDLQAQVSVFQEENLRLATRLGQAEAEVERLRSTSAAANGSGRLSSFPVNVVESQDPSVGRGGTPMRPGSSASGRASPQKRPSGLAGRQDSFFKDLNPLG